MPYGQDAKLALAFQTSHGTVVSDTSSFYPMPFLSEALSPDYPELLSENMEGRFDEGEAYSGARNVGGTLSFEAQPVTLGVALKAICGTPTVVTSGSLKNHTFKPRTSDFDVNVSGNPMTLYKNLADGGTVPIYYNLVCTRVELGVSNGEFLTVGMDLTGGVVGTKINSADIGSATGKKWTWDVTSLQLGGAANTDFADLTISLDEQASPRHVLQTSRDPARVKRDGRRQIRVSGTVRFSDQTEYDLFLAQTTQAMQINMTGTTEIQSGYYDTLQIKIPSFKYLSYPVEFGGPEELQVSFDGKAEYHAGSGTAIEFLLINTYANF
jgi:hypothetical protein